MAVKDAQITRLSWELESASSEPVLNAGKGINQVGDRQRRRKISQLKESCQRALWFTQSYHLDGVKVIFQISGTEEKLEIPLTLPLASTSTTTSTSTTALATASTSTTSLATVSGHEKVQQTLYYLDRFAVSDEFYHELAMLNHELPRSYLIKKERACLNSSVELQRLPSPYHGWYRPFREYLVECLTREVTKLMN